MKRTIRGRIDLSRWNFDLPDCINARTLLGPISDILTEELRDRDHLWAYLEESRKKATISICLPFGKNEFGPTVEIQLSELVDFLIGGHMTNDGTVGQDKVEEFSRLRDQLRALATRLDRALPTQAKPLA